MVKALEMANLSALEARELFEILDWDDSNWVSQDEFVDGALRVRLPLKSKHVLAVEMRVVQLQTEIRRIGDRLLAERQATAEQAGPPEDTAATRGPEPETMAAKVEPP